MSVKSFLFVVTYPLLRVEKKEERRELKSPDVVE